MITFTLPAELRPLAWSHQRTLYQLLFKCAWDTLNTFSQNDKQLKGTPGMVAVLHTHSRRLDYHPHLHTIIPAGAMDKVANLWRKKEGAYLFNHKALAKVFRGKMLEVIKQAGLPMPANYPEKWVIDCKQVDSGDKAFVYLGRYLYKGVIRAVPRHPCPHGISESIHVRKISLVVVMVMLRFATKRAKATAIKPEHYSVLILSGLSRNLSDFGGHEITACYISIVKHWLKDCIIY